MGKEGVMYLFITIIIIILCWNILEGLVPQQGNIRGIWRPYKGRLVDIPTIKSTSKARLLREASFTIQGGKLFNSLTQSIRNYRTADGGTLEGFKRTLGNYLQAIPDLPRDPGGGWMPDPTDQSGYSSNSLHHWRPFLQKNYPSKIKIVDLIISIQPGAVPGGASQESGLHQDTLEDTPDS